ncbi:hypothetical protein [Nostoc sp. 'Peltigera membranacea cyanobiont' 232]|uniref:hypothetical protein n=1 Tax=Nostoc sp. 'Peltigera membranacea cyanobiont' 232 TaxID=2014531 RepID=UPI000B9F33E0|nr:hypothetical protein [Nostoc sp. 'Peltigera membranacea cyanobiont' 232]OYD99814.1 hypothetical protein CDG79_38740 [Nostoc sp. 'Peltigera membranacea cyanobiont' 232]
MTDNSSFNQEESDKYQAAFKQLSNTNTIPLLISELAAFMLIAQLQLALRHPNNIGASRDEVRESIQPIVDYFTGDVREILERGFHPEFDIDTTPQPDPDWDYYETWQLLHTIKKKIDAGIKFISGEELADNTTDEKLKQILEPALEQLEEVIENHLTNYSDDDE